MINTYKEGRIGCALVWGYEWGGLYVPYSHLRLLWAGRFITGGVHACWTTSGEFCRVGPRVGKFVEAYDIPKAMVKFVEAYDIPKTMVKYMYDVIDALVSYRLWDYGSIITLCYKVFSHVVYAYFILFWAHAYCLYLMMIMSWWRGIKMECVTSRLDITDLNNKIDKSYINNMSATFIKHPFPKMRENLFLLLPYKVS